MPPTMAFIDVVYRIVVLAKARNAEDAQQNEPRPAEHDLVAFLEALDEPTILKLEAVMYGGRDKNPNFRDLKAEVSDGKVDAIRTMVAKTPLGDYLAEGLVLAQQAFVDLEGEL